MYLIHKAYIRKECGEYIATQECHIQSNDIDYSRQMIYAELQTDYLPQIIYIDLAYVESNYPEETFKLKDKVINPRKKLSYGL